MFNNQEWKPTYADRLNTNPNNELKLKIQEYDQRKVIERKEKLIRLLGSTRNFNYSSDFRNKHISKNVSEQLKEDAKTKAKNRQQTNSLFNDKYFEEIIKNPFSRKLITEKIFHNAEVTKGSFVCRLFDLKGFIVSPPFKEIRTCNYIKVAGSFIFDNNENLICTIKHIEA